MSCFYVGQTGRYVHEQMCEHANSLQGAPPGHLAISCFKASFPIPYAHVFDVTPFVILVLTDNVCHTVFLLLFLFTFVRDTLRGSYWSLLFCFFSLDVCVSSLNFICCESAPVFVFLLPLVLCLFSAFFHYTVLTLSHQQQTNSLALNVLRQFKQ